MELITTDGNRIYWERHGSRDGATVLLITGFGGNAAAWAGQYDCLADYHVVTFDNRGAGRSTQDGRPCTMAALAGDAVDVLDAADAPVAHVVGHSMGGMIAQHVALTCPQRVLTLALLSTTPGGQDSIGFASMLEQTRRIVEQAASGRAPTPDEIRAGLELWFTADYLDAPRAGLSVLGAANRWPATLPGMRSQLAAIAGHATLQRLPEIAAPTLLLAGDADTLIDWRNSPLMAQRLPDADLQLLPGLRHGPVFERPDLVNAALLRHQLASSGSLRSAARSGRSALVTRSHVHSGGPKLQMFAALHRSARSTSSVCSPWAGLGEAGNRGRAGAATGWIL